MKKLLLLAAAAVTFGASAQTLTQMWKNEDVKKFAVWDTRQGVGMNGKVYINVGAEKKVYVVDEKGISATTLPGTANTTINRDQAGNLIVSTPVFPTPFGEADNFLVYNPQTPDKITTLEIPTHLQTVGRIDYTGLAKGDLTAEGELILIGNKGTGIYKLVVTDGATSNDDSYIATCEGANVTNNMTVVNTFKDGEVDKYLYVTRNTKPAIIVEDGDNYKIEKELTLENKGACNGAEIFTLGGKKYIVYPTLPNYLDGFAIACIDGEFEGAIPAVAVHKEELTGDNPNGGQANWLNAEVVSDNEAIIHQFIPGAYAAAYSFKLPAEQTGINDVNAAKDVKVRKVYENGQVYIIKGDVKYNVMGAQVK